jgi:hypothetical protein
MPSRYFQNSPRVAVEQFFDFPVDFIVNTPFHLVNYREVIMGVCESRYTKAMLSPRWVLTDGKHNVYSTTVDQISDQALREQVMKGMALAHRSMGEQFVHEVLKLFGSLIGAFLMAETFYQIDVGFYQKSFKTDDAAARIKPYDFKPFYLSVLIGQLEMHYPPNVSGVMAPELCRRLQLSLEEVIAVTRRVKQVTGRPKMDFTFH